MSGFVITQTVGIDGELHITYLARLQRHTFKAAQLFVRPHTFRHAVTYIQLHYFRSWTRTGVRDAHRRGHLTFQRHHAVAQHHRTIRERAVTYSVAERIEWVTAHVGIARGVFVKLALPVLTRSVHLAVGERVLPHVTRQLHRQPARRIDFAEQDIRQGVCCLAASEPRL